MRRQTELQSMHSPANGIDNSGNVCLAPAPLTGAAATPFRAIAKYIRKLHY